VRSYCEAIGIPVQLASETLPPFWRLREVRAFLAFVRAAPAKMLTTSQMQEFIASQPENRWWTMISDAVNAFSLELDGKAVPVADLIEMLAEWARDARHEQRGLMLLTAHRAKGLEFDDVVILDGSWGRQSRGEDLDAPRRLFYVAMTRARRNLTITTIRRQHPLVGRDSQGILQRQISTIVNKDSDHSLRYQPVEPQMVDLSWTGRQGSFHLTHSALTKLQTDDPVTLIELDGRWLIRNTDGVTIGRMAKSYRPPDGLRFIQGSARAIIQWRKVDSDEEYQGGSSTDRLGGRPSRIRV